MSRPDETVRFDASLQRVGRARLRRILDPEQACKFLFATPTETIVRCEIDARVGGSFVIVARRDGQDVAHLGTYRELARPRRIAFALSVSKYFEKSWTRRSRRSGCSARPSSAMEKCWLH